MHSLLAPVIEYNGVIRNRSNGSLKGSSIYQDLLVFLENFTYTLNGWFIYCLIDTAYTSIKFD